MKTRQILQIGIATLCFFAGLSVTASQNANSRGARQLIASDYSHANRALPDGVIAWDALMKTDEATNGQDFARFVFTFTNIAKHAVTILNVHPSCGCTTAELPPVPWKIAAGSNGVIRIKVNLRGKRGIVFKSVNVATDKGNKALMLKINIHPQAVPQMTDAQRVAGIAAAKVDRQAVFKGDCASCHAKDVTGKYGQQLFAVTCAICHDAKHRATMVPDLHIIKVPTDEMFWRTWIAAGKTGTLMPAFAKSQGGPLTDLQITSLAAYLNAVNPSRANPSNAN